MLPVISLASGHLKRTRRFIPCIKKMVICPISPDRIILLTANGACGAPKNVAFFSNEVLRKPKLNPDRKSIVIHARKYVNMKYGM